MAMMRILGKRPVGCFQLSNLRITRPSSVRRRFCAVTVVWKVMSSAIAMTRKEMWFRACISQGTFKEIAFLSSILPRFRDSAIPWLFLWDDKPDAAHLRAFDSLRQHWIPFCWQQLEDLSVCNPFAVRDCLYRDSVNSKKRNADWIKLKTRQHMTISMNNLARFLPLLSSEGFQLKRKEIFSK